MKWSAPTWWSWTKRAAKGAFCQVVLGRYMPMSSPVWVGIAQCAATRNAAATATPSAIGVTCGAQSGGPGRGVRSAKPIPSPTISDAKQDPARPVEADHPDQLEGHDQQREAEDDLGEARGGARPAGQQTAAQPDRGEAHGRRDRDQLDRALEVVAEAHVCA